MAVAPAAVGDLGPRDERRRRAAQVLVEDAALGEAALGVEGDAQLGPRERVGQTRPVAVDPGLRLAVAPSRR